MPTSVRWIPIAERGCLVVFFAWLAALPLPFGSVVEGARLPLIAVPLALCTIAALLRYYATRDRTNTAQPTRAWLIWALGGFLFVLVGAAQLVPLPSSVLRIVSPESDVIWARASAVAALAGVRGGTAHPVTIDPAATKLEVLRMMALLGTFLFCALQMRHHVRRMLLAAVLCLAALFETLYGVREAVMQRYAIWGWVNRLIFNRVTGTFVNPNHFAHYIAIVLPMAVFLIALAWHDAGPPRVKVVRRLAALVEHQLFFVGFAVLSIIACLSAMLLASSRGALLALAAGFLGCGALLPGRRVLRVTLAAAAGAVVLTALIFFLGIGRTVGRFTPSAGERETFGGRRVGITAAARVWERFSLLGSGLGTFSRVVSMEQREDLDRLYNHAHNDYMEFAATSGTLGIVIALVTLLGGTITLVRMTFGAASKELSWRRRAYQAAALTSIFIAMVHALVDFNFFIPANPATLAAIAGAAVATVDHDLRARRASV
ncbi:MAG: O-antigen ligase family protein [Acidobacteria bacterium]|nr:O-antigen ligase family protein [Acidobacteriota bacterium]MBV9071337.1 O-antigen ligase family protein [Acidobacteriota bacterium]MBV9476475.1 O-antigen ligase family protein [Acidobacteriota bacterium]